MTRGEERVLPGEDHSSRKRFYVFSKSKKRDFLRFSEVSFQKNVKNVESVIQVFTLLHFKIAN